MSDRGLNGNSSLAYKGVRPATPPNLVIHPRVPTTTDYKEFCVGDIWINNAGRKLTPPVFPGPGDVFMLTSVARNVATWVPMVGGLMSLTGTDNIAVHGDALENINLTSATGGITITNTAANTLSIDLAGGGGAIDTFILDQGTPVSADAAGEVTLAGVAGRTVTTGDGANHTVTVDIGPTVPTRFGTNTDEAIPVNNFLNVIGGMGVVTSSTGNNVITIDATGVGAAQYDTDQGSAFPLNGIIRVVGGAGIRTTGNGNIITIINTGAGPVPTLLNTTVYDTPGTYNWNRFAGATRIVVYIWSGGGGGGMRYSTLGSAYDGSGGGAGSLRIINIAAPAAETVTVGAGGSGAIAGVNNGNPTSGTISSFGAELGTYVDNKGQSGSLLPGGQTNGGTGWNMLNGGNGSTVFGVLGSQGSNTATLYATGGGGASLTYSTTGFQGGNNSVLAGGAGGTGFNYDGNGKDGNDGFTGSNYSIGGTGGGGAGDNYGIVVKKNAIGGNGGWPSGGGGAGGGNRAPGEDPGTGHGGNGGDGAVVVLEYDF